MKIVKYLLGLVFSAALLIACFFTAIDLLAYGGLPSYYTHEYRKYGVYETVKTDEEDLARVTREMMAYLKGDRERMDDITATVDGVPDTLFFTDETELVHMADCRVLFIGGFRLRRICLAVCAAVLVLLVLADRAGAADILARSMIAGTVVFFLAAGAAGALFAGDFDRYFTRFHEMFFSNDLWLLDPSSSRLINIVPEGFFMDTVRYIILIFAAMTAVLLILSAARLARQRRKRRIRTAAEGAVRTE